MDLNDLAGKFETPPNKWGKKEIERWLSIINMAEYKKAFGKSFF